jgi:peptidoglycan/LPS O-acetylase OafA/YrhL
LVSSKTYFKSVNIFKNKTREIALPVHHEKRIVGLDVIRAVAVLLVVYSHGKKLLPTYYYQFYERLRLIRIDGVDIFFVLSGFLIGRILLKLIENTDFTKRDLLNFWIRRWFRTLPNYFLVLIVLLLFRIIIYKNTGDFSFSYLFFFQNFYHRPPKFFQEAWSLSVEEWFYLLLPVLCYLVFTLSKNKSKAFIGSTLIFLIVPFISRAIKHYFNIGSQDIDMDYRRVVIFRLDSLMYGILGAYLSVKKPLFWRKNQNIFLIAGIMLLTLFYFVFISSIYVHFNLNAIGVFCFLPFFANLKTTKSKVLDSIIRFISTISYSVYLLNATVVYTLIFFTNTFLGRRYLPVEDVYKTDYLMYLVYTFSGACLLYYFFEKPMTNLREKFKFSGSVSL